MDKDRIIDALLRLQDAFAEADLAPPSILLGSEMDMGKLAMRITPSDLMVELPREYAADYRIGSPVPQTEPMRRTYRPTLAGVKLYEPHEMKRG